MPPMHAQGTGFFSRQRLLTLADDSGLEVDALNGPRCYPRVTPARCFRLPARGLSPLQDARYTVGKTHGPFPLRYGAGDHQARGQGCARELPGIITYDRQVETASDTTRYSISPAGEKPWQSCRPGSKTFSATGQRCRGARRILRTGQRNIADPPFPLQNNPILSAAKDLARINNLMPGDVAETIARRREECIRRNNPQCSLRDPPQATKQSDSSLREG